MASCEEEFDPISPLSSHTKREICSWAKIIFSTFQSSGKLMIAGNGGSAAQAQHLAAEFVGRFKVNREPLPAMSLCADSSVITAISNDFGFSHVFARQIRALGRKGDVVLLLSTSGSSENLLTAAKAARDVGVKSWSMTGSRLSALASATDEHIEIPGQSVSRIQEVQLCAIHFLAMSVDDIYSRKG